MPINEEKLYRLDRLLRASGMAPLTASELRELVQRMEEQGVTPSQLVSSVEGGFITPTRRNILGRPVPPAGQLGNQ